MTTIQKLYLSGTPNNIFSKDYQLSGKIKLWSVITPYSYATKINQN